MSKKRKPELPEKSGKVGIVYLIKVRGGFRPRHKIGRTRWMEERFESISAMTKADDVLLKWILVKDYEYWERWLQNRYSDKNRYFKELKGNGGTEVFALHWLEVLDCMCWMEIIKHMQKPRTWLLGLFLLTALFFTITWEVWDFGKWWQRFTETPRLYLATSFSHLQLRASLCLWHIRHWPGWRVLILTLAGLTYLLIRLIRRQKKTRKGSTAWKRKVKTSSDTKAA